MEPQLSHAQASCPGLLGFGKPPLRGQAWGCDSQQQGQAGCSWDPGFLVAPACVLCILPSSS